jgi:hypothetical protein
MTVLSIWKSFFDDFASVFFLGSTGGIANYSNKGMDFTDPPIDTDLVYADSKGEGEGECYRMHCGSDFTSS